MKYLALMSVLLLTACTENYRYPCQDPDNWESKECKKPYCSANGTCPEDLTHYEKKSITFDQKGTPIFKPEAPQTSKGDCK